MEVYRISIVKWTKKLTASGYAARWNSKGKYVIYTASSRALACLENIVHRSGEGLNDKFKVMLIKIPNDIKIEEIKIESLPKGWSNIENYSLTQKIGDEWIESSKTAVLKVPSAIVNMESNYLINPNHKEFNKIKLVGREDFKFDKRLKN